MQGLNGIRYADVYSQAIMDQVLLSELTIITSVARFPVANTVVGTADLSNRFI